jgi:ribosomal protein S18 acetylase RimI-like enzyme
MGRMASAAAVLVRPARAGDPAAIGAVQARAWRIAYGNLLPEPALAALTPEALTPVWERAVRTPPSAVHGVLVAVGDDLVVGFAAAGPSADPDAGEQEGQLAVLAVDPAHQRQGHGSRLLSAVVAHLRDAGMTSMTAWVPEGDLARTRLLTTAGMVLDGARRTFAGPDDSQVAEIRLSAELAPADD